MREHGLTAKQRVFIFEYLKDLNGTKAAIRAKYSVRTAAPAASRLLRNVKVSAEIQKAMRRRVGRLELRADRVLREIAELASANMYDYVRRDKHGHLRVDIDNLNRDSAKGLVEYSKTKGTIKIKLVNKLEALELLGKHLGLFMERHAHEFSGLEASAELTAVLGLRRVSDRELDAASQLLEPGSPPNPEKPN
jgi:phage terminase small subunit